MRSRLPILGVVLLLLLALGYGMHARQESNMVRLVSSLPLQGANRSMADAIQMAVEEADYRAGPFRVEYLSLDDSAPDRLWDENLERQNARRAANDTDTMVYIGTANSGGARLAVPILNQAGLAMVSPANTYPGLTVGGPTAAPGEPDLYYPSHVRTFCRLVPNDDVQGRAQAWWAQSLGCTRVYILNDTTPSGRAISTIFAAECQERHLTVVGSEDVERATTDFGPLVIRIQAVHADLIYFGGSVKNGVGPLFKQLRGNDVHAAIMGSDGIRDQALIEQAGNAAEGCYVTFGAMPMEKLPPAAKEWYDRYMTRFHTEPGFYTMYAYEAAKVALDAIARAGVKDRRAVRDALFATHDFHGVLGSWGFDTNGDTTNTAISGYRVDRHRFQFVQMLNP